MRTRNAPRPHLYDRTIVQQATDRGSAGEALERAMSLIDLLANEIGPRRPTGRGERLARALMREELRREGIEASIEDFDGYASFGLPFGMIEAAATLPSLLPPQLRRVRSLLALAAAASLVGEGSLQVAAAQPAAVTQPQRQRRCDDRAGRGAVPHRLPDVPSRHLP